MIVLICGLPGSGKSTLAAALAPRLGNAVRLNGDEIRATLNSDLTFSPFDRIAHAWRIGAIARLLDAQGFNVIADFVCPTAATREAFGRRDLLVHVAREGNWMYDDTTGLWEPPPDADVTICDGMTVNYSVNAVIGELETRA